MADIFDSTAFMRQYNIVDILIVRCISYIQPISYKHFDYSALENIFH